MKVFFVVLGILGFFTAVLFIALFFNPFLLRSLTSDKEPSFDEKKVFLYISGCGLLVTLLVSLLLPFLN